MSIAAKLRSLKNANYRETEPLTFPDGTQVILSTLTGEEDREMADYLLPLTDRSFGHYTKLETLAHAIKWLRPPDGEEVNLRGLKYIETGESLPDGSPHGSPQRTKRNIFMREIVNSWQDGLIDTLFMRYARLMEEIEKDIGKGIQIEMGDGALIVKISGLADELESLVQDAHSKGLKIDSRLAEYFGIKPMGDEGGDKLLGALKHLTPAPEPAPPPPRPMKPVRGPGRPPKTPTQVPGTAYLAGDVAPDEEAPARIRQ